MPKVASRSARHADDEPPLHETLIVERILSAVIEQRLAPGTKLSEATLCETFGVGRMHVRRALLRLSAQGVVDLQSNRGAFIAQPNADDARDVFETRHMIEPNVVRKVAREASTPALRALRDHIDREQKARAQRNRRETIRLSGEFHVLLAQSANNRIIARLTRELITRSSLIIGMYGTSRASACREDEHLQILEAISTGDGERAATLVREHLEHIEADLDLSPSDETTTPSLRTILGST